MRLKDSSAKNGKTLFIVSIPEGAIEGYLSFVASMFVHLFQYPKVRLKVKRAYDFEELIASFNTRRCD